MLRLARNLFLASMLVLLLGLGLGRVEQVMKGGDGDGDADGDYKGDGDHKGDADLRPTTKRYSLVLNTDADDSSNSSNNAGVRGADTDVDGKGDSDNNTDADGNGNADTDGGADANTDADGKGDTDADGKGDSDGDDGKGDTDGDAHADTDADGKGDADPDGNGNADTGGGADANTDADGKGDADADADSKGDSDSKGDTDGVADAHTDTDGKGDADADGKGDSDGDSKGDTDGDAHADTDADGKGDIDADGKGDSDGDDDTDGDADADTDADGKGDAGADGKGDADADSKGDSDGDDGKADTDGDTHADTDADGKGDADADGKGDSDGDDGKGDTDGDVDADGDIEGAAVDGDGGGYRPKYGVVNGQGCTGYSGCKEETRQPYFIWTRFHRPSANKYRVGGMVYFEWRGDRGGVIVSFIVIWLIVFVMLMIMGTKLQGRYQAPLCQVPVPGSFWFYLDLYSPVPLRGSWAELTVSMWIVVWLVLCFLYVWNHADINNLVGKVPRGIGGMVAGMLTIQVFPVARRSVLLWTFGIPFERALKFHKKLGLWIWLLMTGHGVGMWAAHFDYYDYGEPVKVNGVWQYKQGLPTGEAMGKAFERLVEWDIGFPHGPPLAGLLCWVVTCLMVVSAAFFRRKHWNTFVVLHTGYALIYPLAWIHYPSLMIFSAIPVLLYLVDFFWGYYEGYGEEGRVVEVGRFEKGTWLTVVIPKAGKRRRDQLEKPGRWVSLQLVGGKAEWEWHPYFVVPTPGKAGATFRVFIGAAGDWSSAVHPTAGETQVRVLGPYGRPSFDTTSVDCLFLCADGHGLSAVLGYLTSPRMEAERIVLIWAFRGPAAYSPFAGDVQAALDFYGTTLWVLLFNTERVPDEEDGANPLRQIGLPLPPSKRSSGATPAASFPGRPDFSKLFADAPEGSVVVACGPNSFTYEIDKATTQCGLPLHKEIFEL